jgi:hypothetical protein
MPDFADPDAFNEFKDRIEVCDPVAGSKMICCEVNAIFNREGETTSSAPVHRPSDQAMQPTSHRNYKLFDNNKCGLVVGDRISGGEDAGLGQFPWAARLGYYTNGDVIKYRCGATLISDFYVLTAAHCLVYLRGGEVL